MIICRPYSDIMACILPQDFSTRLSTSVFTTKPKARKSINALYRRRSWKPRVTVRRDAGDLSCDLRQDKRERRWPTAAQAGPRLFPTMIADCARACVLELYNAMA